MKIFDPLRKKEVELTPEERVRQAVILWLRDSEGIPFVRMMSEVPFKYHALQYRADIIAYDRNLNPEILVECKAPSVRIDGEVIDQVVRYTRVLKVKKIVVTNGKETYFFQWNGTGYSQSPSLHAELLKPAEDVEQHDTAGHHLEPCAEKESEQ